MLRPLALDVAAFLLPGVLCAGLFLLGTRFRRWPRAVRGAATAPKAWTRFPDSSGLLQQTSATTCSATAATMLLALAGIPASEGEMAYLSGTSLLGADAQGMSLALDQKAASHGWRVEAGPTTYDECVHRGGPFLAHVKGRTTGHAVVVYAAVPEGVIIFDPAVGRAHAEKREDFEPDWDGTAIRLVR